MDLELLIVVRSPSGMTFIISNERQSMESFFMHILTLLHRHMGKCQISSGDIEIAKQRLGQATNIFKLENIFLYHILPRKKTNIIMSTLRKNVQKSRWYI